MAKKICKFCGKEFDGLGTSAYCTGPHYSKCEVCGKEFEINPRNPARACSRECKVELGMRAKRSKTTICEYCGKEFQMKNSSSKYCDGPHYTVCAVCGERFEFTCSPNEMPRTCSRSCQEELKKQTSLKKYGFENPAKSPEIREKIRSIATSEEMVERRRRTSLEHWGVDNPAKSPEIKAKIAETVRSDECQSKMRAATLQRFGKPFAMQSREGIQRYSESCMEKYGVPFYCMTEDCRMSQGDIVSSYNRQFGKLISDIGLNYSFEKHVGDYSYDIHVTDTNILIEIDPTYTHNVIGNHWGSGVSENYHIEKTKIANEHGYRCIHVFDWDDADKVIKLLCTSNMIYARNCTLKEIDHRTASEFENENHIQGKCNGQSICYGLYNSEELVEVMTFGKPRYNKKYIWELLRLCTKSGYTVVGGASKLFKHFLKLHSNESIISYCDLSKFGGEIYTKIGMQFHNVTNPGKIWSKGDKKITNNLLLQRGYDQLFNTNYGKGTSNEELMLNAGWLPVYDCGQAVYVYGKSL